MNHPQPPAPTGPGAAGTLAPGELLSGLLNALDDGVWCMEADPPHRILVVSDAVGRIFGRPAESLASDFGRFVEAVHPDDREAIGPRALERVLTEGSGTAEYRVLRPDGSVRRVEDRASIWRDAGGAAAWIVGIVSDVTERRRAEQDLRQSLQNLRALMNATHESVFLIGDDGTVLAANETGAARLGFRPDELVGRAAEECMPPDVAGRRREWVDGLFRGQGPWELEDERGGRFFRSRAYAIRDRRGRVTRLAIFASDVTDARRTESALAESEERWRTISELISDFAFSFRVEEDGRVVTEWLTASVDRITGRTAAERDAAGGWIASVHADDRARVAAALREGIESREKRSVAFRVASATGDVRHLRATGRPILDPSESRVVRVVGAGQDVTEQVRAEEALRRSEERFRHEALHDALTGVPNRRYFLEQLERAVDRTRRRRRTLAAVLYLDLDRFKWVNDHLGHDRGDLLLAETGRRLEASVRPGDVVGRLGGDEFGILLDDVNSPGEAIRVAERIQRSLSAPFDLDGHEAQLGASIGIALSGGEAASAEEMLREADIALYRAKRKGPGRHELFDGAMQAATLLQMEMERDLQHAADRGELRLAFQPVVSMRDGTIVAAEALLRWEHPRRGRLVPGDFLELAEETGALVGMGAWALGEACRTAATWPAGPAGPPRVLVNVSSRELREEGFVETVLDALSSASLAPGRLELEVSEPTMMGEGWGAAARLDELVRDGVGVSLDDFGRTSLALDRLRRVPVRSLKIDQDLVRRGPSDPALPAAAVALARTLGLRSLAEGVESEDEWTVLAAAGCDEAQGWLVAAPTDAAALRPLLLAGRIAVPGLSPASSLP